MIIRLDPNEENGKHKLRRVPYTIMEKSEMIERTTLSEVFGWKEILSLSEFLEPLELDRGNTLFIEGEPAEDMYILVKGKLSIYKKDSTDIEKLITRISAGKTVGEMALLDGQPRSATAKASTLSTLMRLSGGNFRVIISDRPKLGVKLLEFISKLICNRLRSTSGALVDFLN
ncbi:cyclic nucleotide-binding domain-containing protein [Limisalsivibrio acetivorans]|uniref:cyclic nucleotide-binding domain-containing protein n=1 Tax=Limisalsivibrio acetivorans TaxID=1304888 RepID=UPI0003B78889|nr:cyclic nucleotide-binding domain-containing protein [Limisalsivibrio acetivorans]